jgi:hypothetical protein
MHIVGVGISAWRDNVVQRLLCTPYVIRALQESFTLFGRSVYLGRLFVTTRYTRKQALTA